MELGPTAWGPTGWKLQIQQPIWDLESHSLSWGLQAGGLRTGGQQVQQPNWDLESHSLHWSLQAGGLQVQQPIWDLDRTH